MSIGVLNCFAKPSVGDWEACRLAYRQIADEVNGSDPFGDSLKCMTMIIDSYSTANKNYFDYDKVKEMIGEVFPFVWVSISFDPDRVQRDFFAPLLYKHELIPFTEGIARGIFQKG